MLLKKIPALFFILVQTGIRSSPPPRRPADLYLVARTTALNFACFMPTENTTVLTVKIASNFSRWISTRRRHITIAGLPQDSKGTTNGCWWTCPMTERRGLYELDSNNRQKQKRHSHWRFHFCNLSIQSNLFMLWLSKPRCKRFVCP